MYMGTLRNRELYGVVRARLKGKKSPLYVINTYICAWAHSSIHSVPNSGITALALRKGGGLEVRAGVREISYVDYLSTELVVQL